MSPIYVAELQGYDLAAAAVKTYRYSTEPHVTGATDTPAHTAFTPRIKQPAWAVRSAFSRGAVGGATELRWGELQLVNNDGGLDDLLNVAFAGHPVTVRLGEAGGAYPADWPIVLKGTIDQAPLTWGNLILRIADRTAELAKPLQTVLYAGNNSLPNGLEGTADDLKGQPKPKGYGKVFNVSPPQVNTSRLIYEVGVCNSVDAGYTQGSALTKGADYSSQSDMETNAPAAGTFRAWPAGGYVRLGSTASDVTFDITFGASSADRTAAQIIKQVALGAGIASGDIMAADVTALDTANSAVLGIWLGNGETAAEAMDAAAQSVGAWWGFDRLGQLRMARLVAPSGTPVATLTADEILGLERVPLTGDNGGIPPWRVSIGYAKNNTVQTSGLASGVSAARAAWLVQEYRTATAEDSAIKTDKWLTSKPLEINALFTAEADASAEAARLLALHGTRRDRLSVRAAVSQALASAVDLGNVVMVQHSRFGLSTGKLFCVIGIEPDLKRGEIVLDLWG